MAELREPSIEEPADIENSDPRLEDDEVVPLVNKPRRSGSGKRGILHRFGYRCFAPRRCRDDADDGEGEEQGDIDLQEKAQLQLRTSSSKGNSSCSKPGRNHKAVERVGNNEVGFPLCPALSCDDWLDNLHCELQAAASRADAAVLLCREPEEVRDRVQWVSRVFVRLVVDQVQTTLFADDPELLQLVVECGDIFSHSALRRRTTSGDMEESSESETEAFTEAERSIGASSAAESSDPSWLVDGSERGLRCAPPQQAMQDFASWAAQSRT